MPEELKKELIFLCLNAIQEAEMRQGCTNHGYYAEILVKQILEKLSKFPANESEIVKKLAQNLIEILTDRHDDFKDQLSEEGIEFWELQVKLAHDIRVMLDDKPSELKIGYSICAGGILNAYREGDLNFEEAVKAIEKLKTRQPFAPKELTLISDEEITKACRDYESDSQKIWDDSRLTRQEKAERSIKLKSVYDRIAQSQLTHDQQ